MDVIDDIVRDHELNQSKHTSEANGDNNKKYDQSVEEVVNIPKKGMIFNSMEEVHDFNKDYARATGFDIMKRRSTYDKDDHVLRYFAFSCARSEPCSQPIKGTLFRGNKHIDAHTRKRLELNDQAGIPMCKNFNVIVEEAGGYDNLPCGQKQCQNYIGKMRRLQLGEGDAEAANKYFARMHKKNPMFYHSIDLDLERHLRNVFWADARSRAAYESFVDVVCFDYTYLTNRYDMPFAPFVGVNHHGQSILLGCGLLSSETKEKYVWLFREWLECMSGSPPKSIITDQRPSIGGAIEKVFTNTFHALCRWHIMRKVPEKFNKHRQYAEIRSSLENCLYQTLTIDEFEECWRKMISSYELEENVWLKSLYEERDRWVPVFTKQHFLAGMSSSQCSESMNSFFDDYINTQTSLKQFFDQYEKTLKKKIENENIADFDSFNTNLQLVSAWKNKCETSTQ